MGNIMTNFISPNVKQIPTKGATEAFASLRESNKPKFTYEIVQQIVGESPLTTPSPIVSYERRIDISEGEPIKRLTIKVSSNEYEKLQRLYDFVGHFDSLDTMLRQMILQPEMAYKFLSFCGVDGNELIDFVTRFKPDGFNWC